MSKANWTVDPAHSAVTFSVRHMMVAKVRGRFTQWEAEVHLDADDMTKSEVDVKIQASSIDTGVSDRDGHLKSGDFLDAENHPEIRFKSKRIEKAADDKYTVVGDLSIRGTTREVTLDVDSLGEAKDPWGNQRAAFEAKTSINRKDFGLTWNQALEAGGVLVGEQVNIEVEVQATQPGEG
jgi:polyisoprenoid-binding protein YceI